MKKVKLIYNPFSGGGKILNKIDSIVEVYQKNGFLIELFRISYDMDLCEIKNNAEFYDHFLISGGDGSLNQILNLLKKNKLNIPFGIIPFGTSNDFAKNLKISKNLKDNCCNIIKNEKHRVDLGKINDLYFFNVATVGIFSDISQGTKFNFKKILGKYAYYIKGIKEFSNLNKYSLKITSESYNYYGEVLAVLVFNGKYAGNINLAKRASLNDGLLDVLVLKPKSLMETLDILQKIRKGIHLDKKISGLDFFQTSYLEIDGEKIVSDIDGEMGPKIPLKIECLKKNITILNDLSNL